MANIKSAQKRIRQTKKRTILNNAYRRSYKTAIKDLLVDIKKGDKAKISDKLKEVNKSLDKAAKKGIIHENKAARLKSRLSKTANI